MKGWMTTFDERGFCGFLACCGNLGFRICSPTLEMIEIARNLGKPRLIWIVSPRNSVECQ